MKAMKLFISYSHDDEIYMNLLVKHFSALKRIGSIETWSDKDVHAGQEWEKLIKSKLIESDIVLLLISSSYLASKYCYEIETGIAMKLYKKEKLIVIPILIRPCDWKGLSFGKIQALPKNSLPISKWENLDEAFLNVIDGIKDCIKVTGYTKQQ